MRLRSRVLAITLSALATVLFVPVAQASPKCRVADARTGQSYGTLQEAANAASTGATLRVHAFCQKLDGAGSASIALHFRPPAGVGAGPVLQGPGGSSHPPLALNK
jgi:hypothetical protein